MTEQFSKTLKSFILAFVILILGFTVLFINTTLTDTSFRNNGLKLLIWFIMLIFTINMVYAYQFFNITRNKLMQRVFWLTVLSLSMIMLALIVIIETHQSFTELYELSDEIMTRLKTWVIPLVFLMVAGVLIAVRVNSVNFFEWEIKSDKVTLLAKPIWLIYIAGVVCIIIAYVYSILGNHFHWLISNVIVVSVLNSGSYLVYLLVCHREVQHRVLETPTQTPRTSK